MAITWQALLDMLPCFPGHNAPHDHLLDTKPSGDFEQAHTGSALSPDSSHIIFCDDRSVHHLPSDPPPIIRAPLTDHVSDIFLLSPDEQMARPYTSGHIALMENIKPFRDTPVGKLPCQSVRGLDEFLPSSQLAVSEMPFTPSPKPAFPSFVDFLPEPLLFRTTPVWKRPSIKDPAPPLRPVPDAHISGAHGLPAPIDRTDNCEQVFSWHGSQCTARGR